MAEITKIVLLRGLFVNLPLLAQGEMAFCTDTKQVWIGDGIINRKVGGDPLPDGDKGDITVSDSGATWEINGRKVGAAELLAVATQRTLGRNSAGSGDVEQVSASQLLDWIGNADGSLLYRSVGGAAWAALPASAGANGNQLQLVGGEPKWFGPGCCILVDQKSSGTDGGSCSAATWQTRTLNTILVNTGGYVSLSSNQFTVQPGTYDIFATAPAYAAQKHQIKLETSGGLTDAVGSSEWTYIYGVTWSTISIRVTISTARTWKISHYTEIAEATNGLGRAVSSGISEQYTRVEIRRVA